ncbi:hypothetical protein F5050DRAFT_1791802 [Lentinula boryana]|uniref:Uncharacterized protein n=1 Tax=Lentinula boryana TaxID=40481 RepID=A0ABQ8PZT2_9AGAR|nr:hypothetical protein F5050DRAFT_1791802 [Lentinula boryana]
MSSTEAEQQYINTHQVLMAHLRPIYARVLVDTRKRKIAQYYADECRRRNLTGTSSDVAFWCRYTAWVQNNISEANQMYIHNPHKDKKSEAKVLSADRDAWDEFIKQQFPEPSSCTQTTSNHIGNPSPSKPSHLVTNTIQDARDNQPTDIRVSKPLYIQVKFQTPVRKLGWRKASEQALLKGVLVANAIKYSIRRRLNQRSSASSGKSMLEKESQIIYSTSKA